MIEQILISALLVSGCLILWKEAGKHGQMLGKASDRALIRWAAGTTAGAAFTMSAAFSLFFEPLAGWIPRSRFPILWGSDAILPFLVQVMVLFSVTLICYGALLILMSAAHYLAHKAEEYHR
jgi:hypothetical protein